MQYRDISMEVISGHAELASPNSVLAAPYKGGLRTVTVLFAQCGPVPLVLEVLPLSHPRWFGTDVPQWGQMPKCL